MISGFTVFWFLLHLLFANPPEVDNKPLQIIFMVGDGMGLSQVSAAFYYGGKESNFSRFPFVGLINTSSTSHKITDSAAGATAFSSGTKTYNGAIGVDSARKPVITLVESLSEKGYATGLVATSSITHATPAAFYAHVPSRSMQEEIALQLVHSQVDVFMGGGWKFFQSRSDGRNLADSLRNHGFELSYEPPRGPLDPTLKHAYLLAEDGMPPAAQRSPGFLADATSVSLAYLDQQNSPFFLMVEGSQIDWGGHNNDATYLIGELLDFDQAVGVALDYAKKQGNTLVIVTADHETGGFTLASKTDRKGHSDYDTIDPSFSTGGHSATLIPVFAYGPAAEAFSGVYDNTDIHRRLMQVLNHTAH